MHVFELQELEDATQSFSPSQLVGKGSHGSVYRGILNDGRRVAVKKQSLALQNLGDNTKLQNEALILSSIPPNPCTINFVGVTRHHKIIVTEYMPNGTLHHLLHLSTTPPPWPKRVSIALQLAEGLRCLHELNPSIVHRDIKSANILFDDDWNAKLADFGLAARLRGDDVEAKLPAGTIGYIDPSYTTPSKLSTKIDAFSYGVVLLELVSGRKAIDVTKSPASIDEWAIPLIEEGRVIEICDKRVCSSLYTRRAITKLLDVAARCLSPKENTRPSMREVVACLECLQMDLMAHRYPWSMNYVRDMVRSMMRRKKSRFSGQCGAIVVTSGACRDADREKNGGGSNNISKGRLLVREILADITLK
ncbi:hypothetical protein C2S52_020036 [Perilla frutescens var. hirtella]|nr:hypothetical protein C2S52_020036 [Perilla frutescens var. hirtella]KAH6805747.1 hypothetical protein C2S51_030578 [Perilla frutescens var. frutescens]